MELWSTKPNFPNEAVFRLKIQFFLQDSDALGVILLGAPGRRLSWGAQGDDRIARYSINTVSVRGATDTNGF